MAAKFLSVGDDCVNQSRCKGVGSVDSDGNLKISNFYDGREKEVVDYLEQWVYQRESEKTDAT